MATDHLPGAPISSEEQPVVATPVGKFVLQDHPATSPAMGPPPRRKRGGIVVLAILLLIGTLGAGWVVREAFTTDHGSEPEPTLKPAVLSVNTVVPIQKTVVRPLEQPGTIVPYAQVEMHAKVAGYLSTLRREYNAELTTALLSNSLLSSGLVGAPLLGQCALPANAVACALRQCPVLDIGAPIWAGDFLAEIDVPEHRQRILEREAFLHQRQEELSQTETILATSEAAVEVVRAQIAHVEADIKSNRSEYYFRLKELDRLRDLVRQRAVERRLLDEKQAQVDAALASWESSTAKLKSAQAELSLAVSKLATVRSDIRVKQAQVKVAEADLEQAHIQANYTRLYAPFNGVLTYRALDEGDFVQNAQSGQPRHLMTITAMDKVKVVVQVPSHDGVLIRVGTEATVTVDSRPGERFYGRVSRTRRMLDPQSRTLHVEIDLDNRDHRLLPGMYGHVSLALLTRPNTWMVPAAALYSRNKVNYLILVENGVARRQPVRIVFDDGGEVEVMKLVEGKEVPLDGSEELVVSGKGEIADGQRVNSPRSAGKDQGPQP